MYPLVYLFLSFSLALTQPVNPGPIRTESNRQIAKLRPMQPGADLGEFPGGKEIKCFIEGLGEVSSGMIFSAAQKVSVPFI